MSNIRAIAYCPLFYGRDFIYEAIQSVAPFVEKILIFYTDKPSHGFATDKVCPETEDELKLIAFSASDKVEWVKGDWGFEAAQRSEIYKYASGYDVIVAFDADEVFCQKDLPKAIEFVANGDSRYYGVNGYVTFWKTFDWEVKDFFRPIRFINLRKLEGTSEVMQTIYHFSCCQSDETMNFKYEAHGHKDELIPNWLQEKYYAWTPQNPIRFLHMTSKDIWGDALPFDKSTLPQSLKNHPRFKVTI